MDHKTYYAKSKRQDGSQPTVAEHLDAVAEYATVYGNDVGMREQARIAGLSHDLGKCSKRFQGVLRGETQNIDHAASSAALLYLLWKKVKLPSIDMTQTLSMKIASVLRVSYLY